ncbi:hypothetical protein PK35_08900 [Tamlana nanhaiensis]|uniref:Outer membrane protein beta-barrel domain-containing protein n=1 Tax=Neotamlana nanhaiensis TaxID=1382798 RepID=A0A0D7W5G5_9FLAO|nr:DUF6048 family protein [Tamlana nanhaiensis]KJD33072.1 hypothetical protein PK35_08900 [Tamlana nanhaiensis]
MKHTLILRISIFWLLCFGFSATAQNDTIAKPKRNKKPKIEAKQDSIPSKIESDSTAVQLKYGLRVGANIGKLAQSFLDEDFSGFEIMADYRIKEDLYIAGELGFDDKNTITDYLDVTSKGSYIKAGIDLNVYQNWLDMDNMVYFGFRVGGSTFSQTTNSFTVYTTNQYWAPQYTSTDAVEISGLTAFWAEIMLGFKVELLTNLYLGANVQLKFLASESSINNFEVLYIPGYGKTYDSGIIGAGYSYFLSYRIPLYKKNK